MRCRAIENNNVVWFGSIGKNEDGTAIFYDKDKNSFSKDTIAVQDSLIQRLSILERELWYRISYGIPIWEKAQSKALIDSTIASIITNHPQVVRINKFESKVENRNYSCSLEIVSEYGEFNLSL